LEKAILCEISWKPFRLVKAELEFYRTHHLPVPHRHYNVRHIERLKERPWRILYLRTCDKCATEMLTVYPKEYAGKVYCESCYQKEIYS
jgi:formylmethanofuran dehydrogenase subunit E